jgi:hypothetical protein
MMSKRTAVVVLAFLLGPGALARAQEPAPPPPPPVDASAETAAAPSSAWFAELGVFAVQPQTYVATRDGISRELRPYLGWTASPELTLGYQFASGRALLVSYRYLGSTGTEGDSYSTQRTPLSTHWLDVDYRSIAYELLPTLEVRVQGGGRFAVIERDGRFESPFEVSTFDSTLVAYGAHLGTRLAWRPGRLGWTFFGSVDVGVLTGPMHSTTRYTFTPALAALYPPSSPPQSQSYSDHQTDWIVNPRLELGLSWEPPALGWLSFEGGVRLDDFLLTNDSVKAAAVLHNLGPFCRCTLRY